MLGRATDLPFDIERHHLVATVQIDGADARMILDTGSAGTVLTSDSVARLHLPSPDQTTAEVRGIGGSRALSVLQSATFKLGDLNGRHLHFGVLDVPRLLGADDIDGLLGMDIMSQFDIDLDLPERRIILYKAIGGCGKPTAALGEPLYVLPMQQLSDQRAVIVPVSVSGVRLRALLDSGADSNTIFRHAAERLGLDAVATEGERSFNIGGIGPRAVRVYRHVIEPVTIGDLTIRNMRAGIADMRSTGDYDLVLGLDFFARVHVWLSFSSDTVVLQFPPRPSPAAGR